MKVEQLKDLQKNIHKILVDYPETRNDDMVLYVNYLMIALNQKKQDYNLDDNFFNEYIVKILIDPMFRKEIGIAPFSSVERARRRVQEKNPNLQSDKIKQIRALEELEYLKYVKEK